MLPTILERELEEEPQLIKLFALKIWEDSPDYTLKMNRKDNIIT